ncbi:restriction endonuclease subunit S [Clostridium sp. Sa3CUN1]|uniref:Restriction endonuclease subunit S n=1 Tax=Clostridium gallinarum TaxID=2762246 RepID=A0ABR8Q2L7_9CLOT|nr:restriction endonuclease subunit S [Clostridium gallinarum]MBD7914673.1 restriction endonuclease subunit S [Clostridium gallinarum]
MEYIKLNELCEINIGKTPSRSKREYWGKGFNWLSISDLKENRVSKTKEEITDIAIKECNMKLVPKYTVVMSFKLSIGKIAILDKDMYTNEAIANFQIKDRQILTPEYLFYALKTVNFNNTDRAVMGATLNKAKLNDVKIPYCNIKIQEKIVKILDKAQELINKRKEQIEALDELVKSKFIEMFGNPATNPKGWEITTIGEIATDVRYGTSKPAVEGGKYPYLRMNNITYSGYLDLNNLKYIDIEDEELEKCVVRKGDVLFNRTNSAELIGKTCVFDLDEPMIIAGYIIRVRLIQCMLPIYLSMFLNSDFGKGLLKGMAKGAVNQANINAQELKSIKIIVPPIELQNQFADFVKEVDKMKLKMEKSLKELEDNFNSLMQKAFKGELF